MWFGEYLSTSFGSTWWIIPPRLEPGRYPLRSFVTIQWAWSMVFHRVAILFLPMLVPSFVGTIYYRMAGQNWGRLSD